MALNASVSALASGPLARFASQTDLDSLESLMHRYLEMNETNQLNFSWMMLYSGDPNVQEWVQGFLERIEKLAAKPEFAGRVSANIAMLAPDYEMKALEAFRLAMPRVEAIHTINYSNRITISEQLNGFLARHPNALAYNLPPDMRGLLKRQDRRRNVEIEEGLTTEQGFPVFASVNFITAQNRIPITATLLRDIPRILSERMIIYNGSNLEVPRTALEFVFAAIAEQLIAASA